MKLVVLLLWFSDVSDIHDVLEITVFDEDKEHKYEFLGKVILLPNFSFLNIMDVFVKILIPLMRIKNGEKKWFKLKEKLLRKKAKGDDPQILVEMNLHWNP